MKKEEKKDLTQNPCYSFDILNNLLEVKDKQEIMLKYQEKVQQEQIGTLKEDQETLDYFIWDIENKISFVSWKFIIMTFVYLLSLCSKQIISYYDAQHQATWEERCTNLDRFQFDSYDNVIGQLPHLQKMASIIKHIDRDLENQLKDVKNYLPKHMELQTEEEGKVAYYDVDGKRRNVGFERMEKSRRFKLEKKMRDIQIFN